MILQKILEVRHLNLADTYLYMYLTGTAIDSMQYHHASFDRCQYPLVISKIRGVNHANVGIFIYVVSVVF